MINLLFAGNGKVFDGILTCLLSIFMRSELDRPVTAYILTMDVSRIKAEYTPIDDRRMQVLSDVVAKFNQKTASSKSTSPSFTNANLPIVPTKTPIVRLTRFCGFLPMLWIFRRKNCCIWTPTSCLTGICAYCTTPTSPASNTPQRATVTARCLSAPIT